MARRDLSTDVSHAWPPRDSKGGDGVSAFVQLEGMGTMQS